MKFTLHVPVEQYGFVALEVEKESASEVKQAYDAIAQAFKLQNGLPEKDFNLLLDEYLSTKTIKNGQELYEKLSPAQRDIVQSIKRSFNRLKK